MTLAPLVFCSCGQPLGQQAGETLAGARRLHALVVAVPVVQQVEAAQDEVEQVAVAQGPLPERHGAAGIRPRRHRHAAQHKLAVVDHEVGLVGAPQAAHLGAPDVVGDEADDDHRRLDLGRHLLGPQHDLVEAVAAHARVQHAPAGQELQLRRPGLPVIDLVAVGERIAHRQDRRPRDLLAGPPQPVGLDGGAGRGIAGARHMAQLGIVHITAAVPLGQDRARREHKVRIDEEISPGRRADGKFQRHQRHQDGAKDQDNPPEPFRTLRAGLIHRSGRDGKGKST